MIILLYFFHEAQGVLGLDSNDLCAEGSQFIHGSMEFHTS